MTKQEKTFIAREFDKLENKLDSKQALYENGYRSGLFDALEVVNKLPIHNVSNCECKNLPYGEIAISSKALTDPNWKD